MFGKLTALLIAATAGAASAQEPAEPTNSEAAESQAPKPVAYKTKKICRTIEVVGSSIPKRSCATKRIPIEPVEDEAVAEAETAPQPDSER